MGRHGIGGHTNLKQKSLLAPPALAWAGLGDIPRPYRPRRAIYCIRKSSSGRQGISKEGRTAIPPFGYEAMCSLNKVQDYVPRSAYLISDKELPPLKHNAPYKPGIKGRVAVIPKDTLDAAYALEEARELLGSTDETMICIFNMINAATPDCGCLSGHSAQEEHLCCRSTLPQALPSRFHRMGELECVYSPSVIGLHENDKKGDFLIPSQESPHKILKYSVISMMAQHKRLNVQSENNWRSKDQNLMVQKMRLILRTAASNRHRRLILGVLGCGIFGHPNAAACWEEFLSDKEFEGWFEIVVFAISDRGNDSDYNTFRDALHGLPI